MKSAWLVKEKKEKENNIIKHKKIFLGLKRTK